MIIYLAVLVVIAIFLIAIIWKFWRPKWLGFSGKSLWDWLRLLAVPIVASFATLTISATQIQIERERSSEFALQQYFSRITELALDERLESRVRMATAIGRAETTAVLRLVAGERAGRVFAFLAEMELLNTFAVEFEGLDLTGAELKGIDLSGLEFDGSELSGADFEGAILNGVDFEGAVLIDADLKKTDLRLASFDEANLKGAEFRGADMRGADLSGAMGLTDDQIAQACVDKTTILPPSFPAIVAPSDVCRTRFRD